jgi:hypothetical protein
MINVNLFDPEKEEYLYRAVIVFNKIYTEVPKEASHLGYYQLWQKGRNYDSELDVVTWKQFMLDNRVSAWYDTELEMALNTNLQKLATEAGNNKSTATLQTLTAILKHKEGKVTDAPDQNKIFVYTHIPLTDVEERLENVTKLRNQPEGISGAIKVFEGRSDNE